MEGGLADGRVQRLRRSLSGARKERQLRQGSRDQPLHDSLALCDPATVSGPMRLPDDHTGTRGRLLAPETCDTIPVNARSGKGQENEYG